MKTRTDLPTHQSVAGTQNQKTVSDRDIPEDNKKFTNADDEVTEGVLPEGQTKPKTSRLEARPSRGVNRGLHP